MTRYHTKASGNIPFTPEEEAAQDAREIEYEAGAMGRALIAKRAEIDEMRDKMIARGFVHEFPDGPGTIQVRDKKDQDSITGVASGAMANMILGNLEAQGFFMDKENALHTLTNEEAIALGQALKVWIEGHYQSAWAHKAALQDPETGAPKSIEFIQNYNIQEGWPT